jgi:hypothetical protein
MAGEDGSDPEGDLLFEYPARERGDRGASNWVLAVFLVPLLVILVVFWPPSAVCLVIWLVVTVSILLAGLTDLLEPASVMEVHQHRMRVRTEAFHPDQLEYIETYFDHGHVGNKVEKRPHYVLVFHWTDMQGTTRTYELPIRMSAEDHASVLSGLRQAIPGIRVLELPEKELRLRK